jgi:lipopolysaccharide transport system permease protein
MTNFKNALWRYRSFILSSILNEFKIRFARSRLGGFWMIVQPLSQVVIYALILSTVMAAKLPHVDSRYAYALYLMSGTLAWSLFNEIVTRCLTLFIDQANLLKKMQFPRVTLPTIVIGSALLNNLMLFVAILVIFSLLGDYPSLSLLWLIGLTGLNVILAVGIGLILGVVNVFIRDLTHIVPILLQLFFWATPIVYPVTIIPEKFQHLLQLNPLYPVVQGYHELILSHQMPALHTLIPVSLLSCALLCVSFFMFRRASPEMVDVL